MDRLVFKTPAWKENGNFCPEEYREAIGSRRGGEGGKWQLWEEREKMKLLSSIGRKNIRNKENGRKKSAVRKTADDRIGEDAGKICVLSTMRTCDPGHRGMTLENTQVSQMEVAESHRGRTRLGRKRAEEFAAGSQVRVCHCQGPELMTNMSRTKVWVRRGK